MTMQADVFVHGQVVWFTRQACALRPACEYVHCRCRYEQAFCCPCRCVEVFSGWDDQLIGVFVSETAQKLIKVMGLAPGLYRRGACGDAAERKLSHKQ